MRGHRHLSAMGLPITATLHFSLCLAVLRLPWSLCLTKIKQNQQLKLNISCSRTPGLHTLYLYYFIVYKLLLIYHFISSLGESYKAGIIDPVSETGKLRLQKWTRLGLRLRFYNSAWHLHCQLENQLLGFTSVKKTEVTCVHLEEAEIILFTNTSLQNSLSASMGNLQNIICF